MGGWGCSGGGKSITRMENLGALVGRDGLGGIYLYLRFFRWGGGGGGGGDFFGIWADGGWG